MINIYFGENNSGKSTLLRNMFKSGLLDFENLVADAYIYGLTDVISDNLDMVVFCDGKYSINLDGLKRNKFDNVKDMQIYLEDEISIENSRYNLHRKKIFNTKSESRVLKEFICDATSFYIPPFRNVLHNDSKKNPISEYLFEHSLIPQQTLYTNDPIEQIKYSLAPSRERPDIVNNYTSYLKYFGIEIVDAYNLTFNIKEREVKYSEVGDGYLQIILLCSYFTTLKYIKTQENSKFCVYIDEYDCFLHHNLEKTLISFFLEEFSDFEIHLSTHSISTRGLWNNPNIKLFRLVEGEAVECFPHEILKIFSINDIPIPMVEDFPSFLARMYNIGQEGNSDSYNAIFIDIYKFIEHNRRKIQNIPGGKAIYKNLSAPLNVKQNEEWTNEIVLPIGQVRHYKAGEDILGDMFDFAEKKVEAINKYFEYMKTVVSDVDKCIKDS